MSKHLCMCGLYKHFIAKWILVEDMQGSNSDSTAKSTSANELATDEASSSFILKLPLVIVIALLKTSFKSSIVFAMNNHIVTYMLWKLLFLVAWGCTHISRYVHMYVVACPLQTLPPRYAYVISHLYFSQYQLSASAYILYLVRHNFYKI